MKLPEQLFAIINPMMKLFLRSPFHWLWSRSIMLITFTGRKSGKVFTTPVRYLEIDGIVRCFSSSENLWWKNLRGGADVVLRIRGVDRTYQATVIENNPVKVKIWLAHYLGLFPQDAAYHNIKLHSDRSLVEEDLEQASHKAVVVEAIPNP